MTSEYRNKYTYPSLRGTACPDYFGKAILIDRINNLDCFVPRNDQYFQFTVAIAYF